MVDFSKRVKSGGNTNPVNPVEIYDSLDRGSETSGLRDAQKRTLETWFSARQMERDLIVKLHTGQGKTLIALLILQSVLNQKKGAVLYVCPNNLLVDQVVKHGRKFGVPCIGISGDIPEEFYNQDKIVVTSVQKVFNGKSKFGLGKRGETCHTIILDDAHACVDSIKDSFTIRVTKKDSPELYRKLFNLFEEDLISQGYGTYHDILGEDFSALAAIPYWAWNDKFPKVVELLGAEAGENINLMFPWQLLKDRLDNCKCFFSGTQVEIAPYFLEIEKFPIFHSASQRIMISATTLNDVFFIKDLGISEQAIKKPILDSDSKWLGEKMLIIPSKFSDVLDRTKVINEIAKPKRDRQYGIVALVSSNSKAQLYKQQGCTIATKDNILDILNSLRQGNFESPIVIVNRYDGIDLPDNFCRILIFDGKPFQNSLNDKYEEKCLRSSDITNIRIAQKIEQGLGRSVRGEKDYSAILIIGEDLVHFLSSPKTNRYFSEQTRKQIEIGKTIANFAVDEIESANQHADVLRKLINQCIDRDTSWKDYYEQEMNSDISANSKADILEIVSQEREAELHYFRGENNRAIEVIQTLIDKSSFDNEMKGWYLQYIARFLYARNKSEALTMQKNAFKNNSDVFVPKGGIEYTNIKLEPSKRLENIVEFFKTFSDPNEALLKIDEQLTNLSFGLDSDGFEYALDFFGKMLGFTTDRPDKKLRQGPDNLWCVDTSDYFLFECKTEVLTDRTEIHAKETGQILNSCEWFGNNYRGCKFTAVLIIPTKDVSEKAGLREGVVILRKSGLKKLKNNLRLFAKEVLQLDFTSGSLNENLTETINRNSLDRTSFAESYFEAPFHKSGKRTI